MIKIYLSPSTQDRNIYNDGRNECDVCYDTAKHLFDLLNKHNDKIETYLPNKRDTLANRVAESDRVGADYHIPIHTNAGGGNGTRVFVYPLNKEHILAKSILESVGEWSIGTVDRIETNITFFEIMKPKAKTIYIEGEFHDTNGNHIEPKAYATAIYIGICKAFNITPYTTNESSNEITQADTGGHYYRVQLGAFKDRKNAEAFCKMIKEKGFEAYITYS